MYVRFSDAEHAEVWDRFEAGESVRPISRSIARSNAAVHNLIAKTGGIRPLAPTVWSQVRMSLAEWEEISRGIAAGESARTICARLRRAPSTISRKIKANGGRARYRACDGEASARRRARRPRVAKLAACPKLRRIVKAKPALRWSPEQIGDRSTACAVSRRCVAVADLGSTVVLGHPVRGRSIRRPYHRLSVGPSWTQDSWRGGTSWELWSSRSLLAARWDPGWPD